uniref:Uncharacterized protein n=1 Tax=uncultured bacterium A1Q1_fos_1815 TaxID=1256553 RepID=L7VWF6_9BACT|nr:hypothetical protein [uncultured bacterium A1Q1_fos_1815]
MGVALVLVEVLRVPSTLANPVAFTKGDASFVGVVHRQSPFVNRATAANAERLMEMQPRITKVGWWEETVGLAFLRST